MGRKDLSEDVLASPGSALASARLRAGVGLDEMARRTRVPREALEAIEADDWSSLPGVVYVRGFIRLYAKEVGFDPDRSIRQFDALVRDRDARDQLEDNMAADRARRAASRAWRVRIIYGVMFVGLITMVWFTLNTVPQEPPKPMPNPDTPLREPNAPPAESPKP